MIRKIDTNKVNTGTPSIHIARNFLMAIALREPSQTLNDTRDNDSSKQDSLKEAKRRLNS